MNSFTHCGICNKIIDPNENWTETDCVICELCKENPYRLNEQEPTGGIGE